MFFVFQDSYVIYMCVTNILCTFHVFMYGFVTTVPSAPVMIGIIDTFTFNSFLSFLAKFTYLSLFLISFKSILRSAGKAKRTILQVRIFYWLTRSGHQMTRLHLKILQNFVRPIFQERFWIVHIPFIRMVKFKLYPPVMCHFLVRILDCAYTIYSYGKI